MLLSVTYIKDLTRGANKNHDAKNPQTQLVSLMAQSQFELPKRNCNVPGHLSHLLLEHLIHHLF